MSSLILEKEAAIKRELGKSQEVDELENSLLEVRHNRDSLIQDNAALHVKVDELKEEVRTSGKQLKQQQQQLNETKHALAKALEKVKERDNDLLIQK